MGEGGGKGEVEIDSQKPFLIDQIDTPWWPKISQADKFL